MGEYILIYFTGYLVMLLIGTVYVELDSSTAEVVEAGYLIMFSWLGVMYILTLIILRVLVSIRTLIKERKELK